MWREEIGRLEGLQHSLLFLFCSAFLFLVQSWAWKVQGLALHQVMGPCCPRCQEIWGRPS